MKRFAPLIFLPLLAAPAARAQFLEKSVCASAGESLSAGGLTLNCTAGEAVVETLQAPAVRLSQGFHRFTAYDLWAGAFPGLGGPSGDPDHDGLSNTAEYVTGGHPFKAEPALLPQPALPPQGRLRLGFVKCPAAAADPCCSCRAEASATLEAGSWSAADVAPAQPADPLKPVFEYQGEWKDRMFLRLRICPDWLSPP